MSTITVKNFVEEFISKKIMNTKIAPDAVNNFIKEKLEIRTYVPFVEKRELCKHVLDGCCNKEDGIIKVDSVSRYILFTITIITKYTNLSFEDNDGLDAIGCYDLLCEHDLLNPILDTIGVEYTSCNNMLNMMLSDIVANNNTSAVVLSNILGEISGSIDNLLNTLSDKVESFNLDLSQIDIEKYKGFLEKLTNK